MLPQSSDEMLGSVRVRQTFSKTLFPIEYSATGKLIPPHPPILLLAYDLDVCEHDMCALILVLYVLEQANPVYRDNPKSRVHAQG